MCDHEIITEIVRGPVMFRFSLLVGISLLVYGASSKPHRAWVKVHDAAVQETVMAEGEDKQPLGLKEVEPPENMDFPDMDIDPSMLIWKAVQESRRRAVEAARANAPVHAHMMPEKDQDARYHLPLARLIQRHQLAHGAPVPASNPETGPKYHQAEPDMDKVFHNFPDLAQMASQWMEKKGGPLNQEQAVPETRRGHYDQPEVDLDDLYHGNMGQGPAEIQVQADKGVMSMPDHRGQAFPEEDLDDLYHKK